MGRVDSISNFEPELARAIERCIATGLNLDLRLTDRGIEIPYVELSEIHEKGRGVGSRALAFIIDVADAYGVETLIPPVSGNSVRFFGRLGFSWPDVDVICRETDCLMMRRHPARSMHPDFEPRVQPSP